MGLNQLKVNETTDGKTFKTVLNSNVHTTNLKEVLEIWKNESSEHGVWIAFKFQYIRQSCTL